MTERVLAFKDFSITWTLLRTAWLCGMVSTADIQDFAADEMGRDTGERADRLFQLFDAEVNPSDRVAKLLNALADREAPSVETENRAKRVCNVVALSNWLERYPEEPISIELSDLIDGLTMPRFQVPYDPEFSFEFKINLSEPIDTSAESLDYYNASQGYRCFNPEDYEPTIRMFYGRCLSELRDWIRHEESDLRTETSTP